MRMLSASLRKRARRGQKSKSFCDGKSKQSGTWSRKRRRRGQAEFGTGRMGAQRGAARTQRRHPSSRRRPPVRARRPGGHAGPAGAGVRGPAGSSGGDRRRLLGRRASKQSMPERGVRARCGAAKAPGGPARGGCWSGRVLTFRVPGRPKVPSSPCLWRTCCRLVRIVVTHLSD